ncbi:MAG: hypothetical protein EHM20_14200 [Alphaproteobacteria bacterium]|nr:MAG: hypothetical protein EHM20_14200 [Alphaproteobacteria bacterium]
MRLLLIISLLAFLFSGCSQKNDNPSQFIFTSPPQNILRNDQIGGGLKDFCRNGHMIFEFDLFTVSFSTLTKKYTEYKLIKEEEYINPHTKARDIIKTYEFPMFYITFYFYEKPVRHAIGFIYSDFILKVEAKEDVEYQNDIKLGMDINDVSKRLNENLVLENNRINVNVVYSLNLSMYFNNNKLENIIWWLGSD